MNTADFDAIVYATVDALPAWVHDAFDNIDLLIVDEPSEVDAAEGQHDLLGLYVGLPLTERGPSYAGELPDVIYIFRNPHLDLGLTKDDLRDEVARTLIHEVAHYFGIDDDHLDEIGWG
jgi:predicted Zn-dependent protease with MMP-like domain